MRTQVAGRTLRIAVGSLNNQTIDAHFGHLRELLIYDVSAGEAELIERREIARYCQGATTCGDSEAAIEGAIGALHDCALLLCSRVGFTPWRALENAGIEPNSEHGGEPINDALQAVYQEWRSSGRLAESPRLNQAMSA
jgi:nitrogen fixation protein NifB